MLQETRVLVTGANGFLGSMLIKKLISLKKYQVSGLVRKTGDMAFLKPFKNKIRLFYGDISQKETIKNAFKNKDIVIHGAAYTSDWGKYSYFYNVNVKGTKNIAELCLENSVKHLIHISSISIYGFDKRVDAVEETKIIPNNYYYCQTKLLAEEAIKHFRDSFHLPVTIVQAGQIYGPNDRTMSYKIIEALNNFLFGICDNGKHLMSPLYIENMLQAIMLIIDRPGKSKGKTYIVTDNIKINWYNYTHLFCAHLKKPMPWLRLPRFMAFGIAYLSELIYKILNIKSPPMMTRYRISLVGDDFHFSPKKIMRELHYKPDTDIKKNIQTTIAGYNEFFCS